MFLPLHATTAGKVTLAFLEPSRVDELLSRGLRPITQSTITDESELRRQLEDIRRKGYGTSLGETTQGLGTLGVPVFGPDNKILAVLGIAYPMQSVARSSIPRLAGILHEAARGLSQRLGCRVYPFGAEAKPAPRRLATTS
jgi:DNA-binding IclR family transcriptional regulator